MKGKCIKSVTHYGFDNKKLPFIKQLYIDSRGIIWGVCKRLLGFNKDGVLVRQVNTQAQPMGIVGYKDVLIYSVDYGELYHRPYMLYVVNMISEE